VNEGTPVAFRAAPPPSLHQSAARYGFNYDQFGPHYDYFLAVFGEGEAPAATFPGGGANVRLVAKSGRFAAYENIGPLRRR
jgi:hypothetical protein